LWKHLEIKSASDFDGQCEAAFQFYARCLGGEIVTMLRGGDSPMATEAPPESRDRILHATLSFGGNVVNGAGALPQQYERPKGFYVRLSVDDPTDAERIFHTLAGRGTVEMQLQKTFWSAGFGVLVDQFGILWEINCE
jgi:PhnB protein